MSALRGFEKAFSSGGPSWFFQLAIEFASARRGAGLYAKGAVDVFARSSGKSYLKEPPRLYLGNGLSLLYSAILEQTSAPVKLRDVTVADCGV